MSLLTTTRIVVIMSPIKTFIVDLNTRVDRGLPASVLIIKLVTRIAHRRVEATITKPLPTTQYPITKSLHLHITVSITTLLPLMNLLPPILLLVPITMHLPMSPTSIMHLYHHMTATNLLLHLIMTITKHLQSNMILLHITREAMLTPLQKQHQRSRRRVRHERGFKIRKPRKLICAPTSIALLAYEIL